LKEVQDKLAKEAEAAKAATETTKSKPVIRDARKLLDAFKAAKAKEEKADPLRLLRDYVSNKKNIKTDKDTVWFDTIRLPKSMITNFKCSVTNNFYTLETLLHCFRYRPKLDRYQDYSRAARTLKFSPVFKPDVTIVLDYLSNLKAQKPPHVVDVPHEPKPQLLNADGTLDERCASNMASNVNQPSKLSQMGESELMAQAQLQMSMVQEADGQKRKRSRFDQAVHPTKGFSEPPPTIGLNPMQVNQAGMNQVLNPLAKLPVGQQPPSFFQHQGPRL
jgi:hypothetical protein